jgi:hypothetical protein
MFLAPRKQQERPMLKSLKSLLGNQPPGDLAIDDWSPVPVNATAQPENTMDWLFEEVDGDVMPLESRTGLPLDLESQKTPSYLDHFSPEELEIIAQQQAEPEPELEPVEPVAEPAPEQRARWIDLLRSCGEHLSEAELKIIRQQLAA